MVRVKTKEGGMREAEFHLLCGGVAPPTNEQARPPPRGRVNLSESIQLAEHVAIGLIIHQLAIV